MTNYSLKRVALVACSKTKANVKVDLAQDMYIGELMSHLEHSEAQELVVLAGENYRDPWWFDRLPIRKVVPMRGLKQGEQLAWLNRRLK